jgi:hypothetical protein
MSGMLWCGAQDWSYVPFFKSHLYHLNTRAFIGPQTIHIPDQAPLMVWVKPVLAITLVREFDHEWLMIHRLQYHFVSPHLLDGFIIHVLRFFSATKVTGFRSSNNMFQRWRDLSLNVDLQLLMIINCKMSKYVHFYTLQIKNPSSLTTCAAYIVIQCTLLHSFLLSSDDGDRTCS